MRMKTKSALITLALCAIALCGNTPAFAQKK